MAADPRKYVLAYCEPEGFAGDLWTEFASARTKELARQELAFPTFAWREGHLVRVEVVGGPRALGVFRADGTVVDLLCRPERGARFPCPIDDDVEVGAATWPEAWLRGRDARRLVESVGAFVSMRALLRVACHAARRVMSPREWASDAQRRAIEAAEAWALGGDGSMLYGVAFKAQWDATARALSNVASVVALAAANAGDRQSALADVLRVVTDAYYAEVIEETSAAERPPDTAPEDPPLVDVVRSIITLRDVMVGLARHGRPLRL